MRIALVSCARLPAWEVDDLPLIAALEARGAEVERPAWDDPVCDWAAFDACLIRTTWDYMERLDEYLAWARRAAAATRLFNPEPVVAWNTHKGYLRDLEAAGVPVVPTDWLPAGSLVDEAVGRLTARGWRHGFVKPAVGATARETLRFAADAGGIRQLRRHLERLLPREDLLLQPYLRRVEAEGELSLVFIAGRLSHAVRKVPVPGDYRVQDDFGASDRRVDPDPAAVAAAGRALAAVPAPWLYARADFLRDDAGDWSLTELELVEPSLFFRHRPAAAAELAGAFLRATGAVAAGAGSAPPVRLSGR